MAAPPQVGMAGISEALPWLAPAMKRLGGDPQNFPMSKQDQVQGLKGEFDRIVSSIQQAEQSGQSGGTGSMLGRLMDINEQIAGLAADPNPTEENNITREEDAARQTADRMRTDFGELDRGDQASAFSDYGDSHQMSQLAEQAAGEQTLGDQTLAPWVQELLPDTLQSGPRVGPGIDPNTPDKFSGNPLAGATDRPAPGIAPADLASPAPQQAEQISARPQPGTVTDDVRRLAAGGTQNYPGDTGHGVQGLMTPAPSPDPAMRGAGVFDPQSQKPAQVKPGVQQSDPGMTRPAAPPEPGMQFMQGPKGQSANSALPTSGMEYWQRGNVYTPIQDSPGMNIPWHALRNPQKAAMFNERRKQGRQPSPFLRPPDTPAPPPINADPFADPFQHEQSAKGLGVEFDPTPEGLNELASEATSDPGYMNRMAERIASQQGSPEGMTGELPRFLAGLASSRQQIGGENWRDTDEGIAFTRSKTVENLEKRMRDKGVHFDRKSRKYIKHDNPKAAALLDEYEDVQARILKRRTDNVLNKPGDFKPQDSGFEEMQELEATKTRLQRILKEEGIAIPSEREGAEGGVDNDPFKVPDGALDVSPDPEGDFSFDMFMEGMEGETADGAELLPSEDEAGLKHPTDDQKKAQQAGHGVDTEYGTIEPSVFDKGQKAVFEKREANADLKTADQRSLADRGAIDSAFSWATGKDQPENAAELESRDVSSNEGEWMRVESTDPVSVARRQNLMNLVNAAKKLPQMKAALMSKTFSGKRHQVSAEASKTLNFIYGTDGLFEKAKRHEADLRQIARDAIKSGDNDLARSALAQARDSMLQRQSILQLTRRDINPRTRKAKAEGLGEDSRRGDALENQNYRTRALSPVGWEKEALELTKALYGPGYSADQRAREAELRLENTPTDFSAGEGYEGQDTSRIPKPDKPLNLISGKDDEKFKKQEAERKSRFDREFPAKSTGASLEELQSPSETQKLAGEEAYVQQKIRDIIAEAKASGEALSPEEIQQEMSLLRDDFKAENRDDTPSRKSNVIKKTVENPRYDSLEREIEANKEVSKTISEHKGKGLMAEMKDLGMDTHVPEGATAASIEPAVTDAQAREAAPRKSLLAEVQESISTADPDIILHHADSNEEFSNMIEQMRQYENSRAHLSDEAIGISDKNPLGFKHPTTAAVANDMALALERGNSPAEAFERFMSGEDPVPETDRVKMPPVDYKTSTQVDDKPAPRSVNTTDMLKAMSKEMGSKILSDEEIAKMNQSQRARAVKNFMKTRGVADMREFVRKARR